MRPSQNNQYEPQSRDKREFSKKEDGKVSDSSDHYMSHFTHHLGTKDPPNVVHK